MKKLKEIKKDLELKFNKKIKGILYSGTNEFKNKVEIIAQFEDGTVKSLKKVNTKGEGTSAYSPLHRDRRSDPLDSVNSIVISNDNQYLFIGNGGDNTVTSFKIMADGDLEFIDLVVINAEYAYAINNLTFNNKKSVLYVGNLHGPNHVYSFRAEQGKLTPLGDPINFNNDKFDNRYSACIVLTDDENYLIGNVFINEDPTKTKEDVVARGDDTCIVKINEDGTLGEKKFYDVLEATFLTYHLEKDRFLMASATLNDILLVSISDEGKPKELDRITIDSIENNPVSESCWLAYNKTNRIAYTSNFGYGSISSLYVGENTLEIIEQVAAYEEALGDEKGVGGTYTSAPIDCTVLNDYFYQIYGDTGELISYQTNGDGTLIEVDRIQVIPKLQFGLVGIDLEK